MNISCNVITKQEIKHDKIINTFTKNIVCLFLFYGKLVSTNDVIFFVVFFPINIAEYSSKKQLRSFCNNNQMFVSVTIRVFVEPCPWTNQHVRSNCNIVIFTSEEYLMPTDSEFNQLVSFCHQRSDKYAHNWHKFAGIPRKKKLRSKMQYLLLRNAVISSMHWGLYMYVKLSK